VRQIGERVPHSQDEQQELASLKRRAAELEKLQAVSHSLAMVVPEAEMVRLIVDSLVSLGYCFAVSLALDREKKMLTDYVLGTPPVPMLTEAERIMPPSAGLPLTYDNNLIVRCIRTLEVQTTQDLAEVTVPILDARSVRLVQRLAGVKTIAVVPVLVAGQPFGVWIMGNDQKENLDAADLRTLVTFADQAGLAIERAQLYDWLSQKTQKLEQALQELRATQDQLVRSERLSSMGRLAASIGHEVSSPLQVVKTCLELTLEEAEQAGAIDIQTLEVAHQEVERVIQTVHRLLNLQRTTEADKGPVDVNGTIQDVLALMHKQFARAHVRVDLDLSPDLSPIWGRQDELMQVILNLMLNALEAMPRGGRLSVSTAHTSAGTVTIAVSDTGVGIPPAYLPRVFEAFFTTKPGGLGLGLAICQMIVEGLGGRIAIASEPGRGTCCQVDLPIYNGEANGTGEHPDR
jgi:signal transduction histidine kinase